MLCAFTTVDSRTALATRVRLIARQSVASPRGPDAAMARQHADALNRRVGEQQFESEGALSEHLRSSFTRSALWFERAGVPVVCRHPGAGAPKERSNVESAVGHTRARG